MIEEGAHVYGVHTSVPDSSAGARLYGVGRDGDTVVQWARTGNLDHVPVRSFRTTTVTAVAELYR